MEINTNTIEMVLSQSASECYETLMEEGIAPLEASGEGVVRTINNLIEYFESKEDYIKCSNLLKLKKEYET